MRTPLLPCLTVLAMLLPATAGAEQEPAHNTLTAAEKAAGWRLLWDGQSTQGWQRPRADSFPPKGWEIQDGVLSVLPRGGGGDIMTTERFAIFDLRVDFKITKGANSGIKYFVQPDEKQVDPKSGKTSSSGSTVGPEFQILDDEHHPDAKAGRNGNRTIASLYDVLTADPAKKVNPTGEWNTARVLATGSKVEHWLNGEKVLEYDRNSAAYREQVAASKFKIFPGFGEWKDGHILLQDHGDAVSFRNIKIRVPTRK